MSAASKGGRAAQSWESTQPWGVMSDRLYMYSCLFCFGPLQWGRVQHPVIASGPTELCGLCVCDLPGFLYNILLVSDNGQLAILSVMSQSWPQWLLPPVGALVMTTSVGEPQGAPVTAQACPAGIRLSSLSVQSTPFPDNQQRYRGQHVHTLPLDSEHAAHGEGRGQVTWEDSIIADRHRHTTTTAAIGNITCCCHRAGDQTNQ